MFQVLRAIVPACLAADRGPRLLAACRHLDGAWLKLGQTASFRYDLFPADVCDALSALQGAKGHASIGSVVRVGDRAVKTIPASRRALIERDLTLLRRFACVLDVLPVLRRLSAGEMVDELSFVLRRELDLSIEGANQRAMRKQLKGRKGIYVPEVFSATADRLETEYIDGADLSTFLSCPETVPNGQKRIRRLLFHLLRMIFEDHRFHGDLHPGNVRLMTDGRLALLDYGTIGVTEADFLRHFAEFIKAIATNEWQWAANQFALLQRNLVPRTQVGKFLYARRLARVERELIRVIGRWATGTHHGAFASRSLNTLTQRMVAVTARAGASLEPAWLTLQRALQSIERLVEAFWPSVDYLKVARRYLAAAARRHPKQTLTDLKDEIAMAVQHLDTLTNQGVRVNL